MTLAVPLAASKGGGALEVGRTYARARELCQQAGDTSQPFLILLGLTGFYFIRAEYQTARDMAAQLLRLAQRSQDPAPLLAAHLGLGSILLFLGEFRLARTRAEQAVALYDPQQHSPHTALSGAFGVDVGMMCFFRAAHILWLLGYRPKDCGGVRMHSPWPDNSRTPGTWRGPYNTLDAPVAPGGTTEPRKCRSSPGARS